MKGRAISLTPRVYGWLNRPSDSDAPRYRWFVGCVCGDAETKEAALAAAEDFLRGEREKEAARLAAREARAAGRRRATPTQQQEHHA